MNVRYWSALRTDLRSIVDDVKREWNELLNNAHLAEEAYQSYLSEHAGFFWANGVTCVVVASKVQLGGDHVTDFVLGFDGGSKGFTYQLVELESPHKEPYGRKGAQSATLSTALRQIDDWQHWISENPAAAEKVFPSTDYLFGEFPNFEYVIVIGRRAKGTHARGRRNRLAAKLQVAIRSFDWLTDVLTTRPYPNMFEAHAAGEHLVADAKNILASPFHIAIPNGEWRHLISAPTFQPQHSVIRNADLLITVWRDNAKLADFDARWQSLPEEMREKYAREWADELARHRP